MLERNVEIPSDIRAVMHKEGGFLVNVESGICFTLNAFGTRIWERLAKGDSLKTIVAEMAATYSRPESSFDEDVERFVSQLVTKGLLRYR